MVKKKKIVIGVGASLLTLMLIVGVMKFNSQPEVEPQMESSAEMPWVSAPARSCLPAETRNTAGSG